MPRIKLSEYRAKTLLNQALGKTYAGVEVSDSKPVVKKGFDIKKQYVVKVDQGIKGRFKKGLVLLDRSTDQLAASVKELNDRGFEHVLIEEQRSHEPGDEKYIMIERLRDGNRISYSPQGGVDIEAHPESIVSAMADTKSITAIESALGLEAGSLSAIIQVFDSSHMVFLEINPLLVQNGKPVLLDAAIEVDSEGEFFTAGAWTTEDVRNYSSRPKTSEELAVAELADRSQASFSLEVINPNGALFLLLSGGGASVVLADEIYNQGYGDQLGNYGEYSGNPNAEETYVYTQQVISLLLKSKAPKKALIIGGGVANFTDIRATFTGVIKALAESAESLRTHNVLVYVRRGGPFEVEGLKLMQAFLEREHLYGYVTGPNTILSDIAAQAFTHIKPEAHHV